MNHPMTTAQKSKKFTGKSGVPQINTAAWRKQQLEEAAENVAYWKRVAAATENLTTRADALARVAIWKTTRDARADKERFLRGKP